MDIHREIFLKSTLFSNKSIRKWNFEKHEYNEVENKYGAKLALIEDPSELDEIIKCTNCGEEITVGVSMTSKQYHNDFGLGFPVCVACYKREWEKYFAVKKQQQSCE